MEGAKRKISVKVWAPVLKQLENKLENACIRRDAYLVRLLQKEVHRLDEEVAVPNSEEARALLSSALSGLDRKLVTLTLDAATVDELDDVCARKRIVRDAFFNRIFLLLAASDRLIDYLFFVPWDIEEREYQQWRTEVWAERKHDGPFFSRVFSPLDVDIDPFWAMRAGLEELYRGEPHVLASLARIPLPDSTEQALPLTSLYTVPFERIPNKDHTDISGFNVYFPDTLIPGHPSMRAEQQRLDDLLSMLEV